MSQEILAKIYKKVLENKDKDPAKSYSASLFQDSKGKNKVLEKLGEETFEVILAAKDENRQQIINEMADLWFHSLALLAIYGIELDDLYQELTARNKAKE